MLRKSDAAKLRVTPDLEDMVPKFIFRTPNEILGVV